MSLSHTHQAIWHYHFFKPVSKCLTVETINKTIWMKCEIVIWMKHFYIFDTNLHIENVFLFLFHPLLCFYPIVFSITFNFPGLTKLFISQHNTHVAFFETYLFFPATEFKIHHHLCHSENLNQVYMSRGSETAQHKTQISCSGQYKNQWAAEIHGYLWPILLTWINLNPRMNKKSHTH